MALLNKLVKSSYNENKIDRRLAELSYSAINGERQEAKSYAPEGVVMQGQIDRERPLEAITKEMIKDYQESQAGPGAVIGGVPYMYKQSGMEPPKVKAPIEYQKYKDETVELAKQRQQTANFITEAENALKKLTETKQRIIIAINTLGDTPERRKALTENENRITSMKAEINDARLEADGIAMNIKNRVQLIDDIKKHNAIAVEENKGKIKEYETALQEANRDRMIIQQQPYESDYDYYKRLKEVEKQRYNPLLYKQISLNQNIVELKQKLPNLFKEEATIEGVIKSLSDDNKFLLNKHFGSVENLFKGQFGYNPSSMSINDIANILTDIIQQTHAATVLQGALKRPSIKEGYSQYLAYNRPADTIAGAWKAKKARQETKFLAVEKEVTDIENKIQQEQQHIQRERDITALTQKQKLKPGFVPGLRPVSAAEEANLQQELGRLTALEAAIKADAANSYEGQVAREITGKDGKKYIVMVPAIINRQTGAIRYKGDEEKETAAAREQIANRILANVYRKEYSSVLPEMQKADAQKQLQAAVRGGLERKKYEQGIPFARKYLKLLGTQQRSGFNLLKSATDISKQRKDYIEKKFAAANLQAAVRGKITPQFQPGSRDETAVQSLLTDGNADITQPLYYAPRYGPLSPINPEDIIAPAAIVKLENVYINKTRPKPTIERENYLKLKGATQKLQSAIRGSQAGRQYTQALSEKIMDEQLTASEQNRAARAIQEFTRNRQKAKYILDKANKLKLEQAKERIIQETLADITNGVATEESKNAAAKEIEIINELQKQLKMISEASTIPAEGESPTSPKTPTTPTTPTSPTGRKTAAAKAMEKATKVAQAQKLKVSAIRAIQANAIKNIERKNKELKEAKERIIQETLADIANGVATEESKQAAAEAIAEIEAEKAAVEAEKRTTKATQIQSLYRGVKGRKSVKNIKLEQAKERIIQETLADIANGIATEKSKQAAAEAIAEIEAEKSAAKVIGDVYRYRKMRTDVRGAVQKTIKEKIAIKKAEKAAAARQKMYDDAYNAAYDAAIAGGASAASAASMAANTAAGLVGTVASTTAGLAGSALTGLGRMAGFFQTPEEKAAAKKQQEKQRAEKEAKRKEKEERERRERASLAAAKQRREQQQQKEKEEIDLLIAQSMAAEAAKEAEAEERAKEALRQSEKAAIEERFRRTLEKQRAEEAQKQAEKEAKRKEKEERETAKGYLAREEERLHAEREAKKAEREARRQQNEAAKKAAEQDPRSIDFARIDQFIESGFGAKEYNQMSFEQIKDIRDDIELIVNQTRKIPENKKDGLFLANERLAIRGLQRANTAYDKARKEGRGLAKKGNGLVKKARKYKISPEEGMKNRLRLVVSQIQAGNTNPKLMIEVNKLYKKLYNIDNAYSLIKK